MWASGSVGKEPAVQETKDCSLDQEDPLEKGMATYSSILAGEFQGQSSLVDYSPWGHKESDRTEPTHKLKHSDRYVAMPHCGFHLHFPHDYCG